MRMVTIILLLLHEAQAYRSIWRLPSIFTILDIVFTAGIAVAIIWFSIKYAKEQKIRSAIDTEDMSNPRGYHNFAKRLFDMEHEQSAMRERLESMAVDAGTRHEERLSTLHDLVEVSTKQYETVQVQSKSLDKVIAQNAWIMRTLKDRPCIINESTNGDEECPEGHDISIDEEPKEE